MATAWTRIAVGLVAAVAVGGCVATAAKPSRPEWADCTPNHELACTTVGGIPVGELVRSWGVTTRTCEEACDEADDVAREAMATVRRDHPVVVSVDEFSPDRAALCGPTLCAVSGYLGIFVFGFSDSTSLPIIVSCPSILPCRTLDRYGR